MLKEYGKHGSTMCKFTTGSAIEGQVLEMSLTFKHLLLITASQFPFHFKTTREASITSVVA